MSGGEHPLLLVRQGNAGRKGIGIEVNDRLSTNQPDIYKDNRWAGYESVRLTVAQ